MFRVMLMTLVMAVLVMVVATQDEIPTPLLGLEPCNNEELIEAVTAIDSTFQSLLSNYNLVNQNTDNAPIARTILELQINIWYGMQRAKVLACPQTAEIGLRLDAALTSLTIALADLEGPVANQLLGVFGVSMGEISQLSTVLQASISED
jgi:hypothetical protein